MSISVVEGFAFSPVEPMRAISVPLTETIRRLVDISFERAEIALQEGGTPVGAALIDMESGQEWYDHSIDKISRDVEDHAEKRTYRQAQPVVLDKMGKCALVSTLELCPMCVTTFAQGDISTIFAAAPRVSLLRSDGSSILRLRKIGMFDLLEDSAVHTNAYVGYRAEESVALWRTWDKQRHSKSFAVTDIA